jgi:hypothetical protein
LTMLARSCTASGLGCIGHGVAAGRRGCGQRPDRREGGGCSVRSGRGGTTVWVVRQARFQRTSPATCSSWLNRFRCSFGELGDKASGPATAQPCPSWSPRPRSTPTCTTRSPKPSCGQPQQNPSLSRSAVASCARPHGRSVTRASGDRRRGDSRPAWLALPTAQSWWCRPAGAGQPGRPTHLGGGVRTCDWTITLCQLRALFSVGSVSARPLTTPVVRSARGQCTPLAWWLSSS